MSLKVGESGILVNSSVKDKDAAVETRRAHRSLDKYALLVLWASMFVVFSFLPATTHTFPTTATMSIIFGSSSVVAVLTLGLLLPLTAGDYDLSVAYTMTLSAMIVAVLNVNLHVNIVVAVLAGLGSGVLVGAVNGVIVVAFGIDSFIVTLGTGTIVGGIILEISNQNTISGVSNGLVHLVLIDRLFGIPLAFYYTLFLGAIVFVILVYTPVGRRLLYVGRNRSVARLSGVSVGRLRIGALIASGFISALAGVFYAGVSGSADPTSGITLLLPAFAGAFLGATAIRPGTFNPVGSLIAVYFLATGITALELLGLQSYVQDIFYGVALVAGVAVSRVVQIRRGRGRIKKLVAVASVEVRNGEREGEGSD